MKNTFHLHHVEFLPADLEEGILYVSKKYNVVGHLCPCGCRNKIITPLGPNEWSYGERKKLPSLYPSIGNWQLPCRSHYFITDGKVEWSYQWTENEIIAGNQREEMKRIMYYESKEKMKRNTFSLSSLWKWLTSKL